MARWGMVIDLDRCTGCAACASACALENNVPAVSREEAERGRSMGWLTMVHEVEESSPTCTCARIHGSASTARRPRARTSAPCATCLSGDGIVAQIYHHDASVSVLHGRVSYTVKTFNWFEPTWSGRPATGRQPDVSLRPKGSSRSARSARIDSNARRRRRELATSTCGVDYQPACVEACPAEAMLFGDFDDPDSVVSAAASSRRAEHLLEELGTEPKVAYLRVRAPHAD
jgi:molybdopterin-containing oxidoreductase family iron-sulfur binding subunit